MEEIIPVTFCGGLVAMVFCYQERGRRFDCWPKWPHFSGNEMQEHLRT